MKRSIKKLIGYYLDGEEGLKGKVKDFLFDEESWIIRYADADFGSLFKARRILIPRIFLREPETDLKRFPVDLTKDAIEVCPDLDEKTPVSREYEEQLSRYYGIEKYWPYVYAATPEPAIYPPRPMIPPKKVIDEKDLDTSLRSFKEVEGYNINAVDGHIGHVEDMLVDDIDWQIVYVVVDTSNWIPWSKKVIISINWLKEISYVLREVTIDLHKETIKEAPEYDPEKPLEEDIERTLFDFFSRSLVK
jgi:hypothetical protein